MQMASVTEQHEKLAKLAGEWTSEETLQPSPWDPKGGPATGRSTARMDLNGFYLITDYEQKRGGQVNYRGHGVYGYDPQKQKYLMYWFDGGGYDAGAPALGTWEGNRLSFTSQGPMGYGRYTYEFTGEGAYTFRLEHSQDGKNWMAFLEGQWRRSR